MSVLAWALAVTVAGTLTITLVHRSRPQVGSNSVIIDPNAELAAPLALGEGACAGAGAIAIGNGAKAAC